MTSSIKTMTFTVFRCVFQRRRRNTRHNVPIHTRLSRHRLIRNTVILGLGYTLLLAHATVVAATPQATITHHQGLALPADGQFTTSTWPVMLDGRHLQLLPQTNTALLNRLPATTRAALNNSGLRVYRGALGDSEGNPIAGSWLRLSWMAGRWSGGWALDGRLYLVDDIATVNTLLASDPGRASGTIMYRLDDVIMPALLDHGAVPAPQRHSGAFIEHLQRLTRGAAVLEQLQLTLVSDPQFSTINGANTNANVAARLNFVDGIYTNQLSVSLGLLHHEILGSNGPLTATDPVDLLNQFASYMRNGAGSSLPRGGLAHFFTGRDLNGSTVGIAYLGVLCSTSFGYGVDQDFNGNTLSALIFAHELGHNFGAPHDGEDACVNETFRGIMNPSINGSTEFSQCSIQQMSDDIAAAGCLQELPTVIYDNGFEAP